MDIQRLRNLTTGRLHTNMSDVQEDLEFLTDAEGILTYMLPNIMEAVAPWLREQVTDERFWDSEWDTTHTGEYEIMPMTHEEKTACFQRYGKLPSPLASKKVIAVVVDK